MTAPNPAWLEAAARAIRRRRFGLGMLAQMSKSERKSWEAAWDPNAWDVAELLADAEAALSILTPLIEAETAERCAQIAEDLGWILPVLDSHILNEATDDAACSVTKQAAAAIRAAFQPFDISSIAYIPEGQISGQSRKESGSESVSDGLSGPQPVTPQRPGE